MKNFQDWVNEINNILDNEINQEDQKKLYLESTYIVLSKTFNIKVDPGFFNYDEEIKQLLDQFSFCVLTSQWFTCKDLLFNIKYRTEELQELKDNEIEDNEDDEDDSGYCDCNDDDCYDGYCVCCGREK